MQVRSHTYAHTHTHGQRVRRACPRQGRHRGGAAPRQVSQSRAHTQAGSCFLAKKEYLWLPNEWWLSVEAQTEGGGDSVPPASTERYALAAGAALRRRAEQPPANRGARRQALRARWRRGDQWMGAPAPRGRPAGSLRCRPTGWLRRRCIPSSQQAGTPAVQTGGTRRYRQAKL